MVVPQAPVTVPMALPDAAEDRLVRNAAALIVSSATGALLGVVFWTVAARLYPAHDVGNGVAEIAAMVLLASLAQVNLGVVFPRYLYAAGSRAPSVVRLGYAVSTSLALLVGVVFLVATGNHAYVAGGVLPKVLFLVAVVLWVVFGIQDAALTGLRRTFWVPVENTSFSAAKIVLLPVFVIVAPKSGVYLAWVVPVIACIVPISYFLFKKVLPAHVAWSAGRGSLPSREAVGSVLVGEYLGGLAYIALQTIPALMVASQLGAAQAAYFQTPWFAGTTFDFLLFNIATSLIVESSARPHAAAMIVRRAVRLSVLFLTPGIVIIVVAAPYFLGVLGPPYAHYGTRLLQCVVLALPFTALNALYITFARLARRMRRVAMTQIAITTIILVVSAVLLPSRGIAALGIGFLVGQGIVAVVVAPSVIRQYRRDQMAPGFAPGAALVALGTSDSMLAFEAPVGPRIRLTNQPTMHGAPLQPDTDERGWRLPPWAAGWRRRRSGAGTSLGPVDDVSREH